MVVDKKVFFGALLDFHPDAYKEVIDQFEESLGANAPFVSYDKANKAFTFMVDRQDDRVVSRFAANLKAYIDEQAEPGPDPYQSPRIRPLDGTVLQDPLIEDVKLDESNEGLLAIDNDADSSDGGGTYDALSHIRTHWKPQQGKISIVTTELATLLAQVTGCSFFPDHAANRVGISGAGFNQALYKLQNLERLQTLLASQRSEESSKAVANILMLANVEQNVAIQFLPLIRGTRPYERILVSEQSQIRLEGKCVGELRYLQSYNRTDHSIPPNLVNPSGTVENCPSGIWSGFTSLPLGSRKTMEPRRPSRSPSKLSSARHAHALSAGATPASLLPPTETRKIESWAQNIDEAVNPNEIAVEPPKDETRTGRQRRLANSDSDSDSDEDIAPKHAALAADLYEREPVLSQSGLAIHGVRGDDGGAASDVEGGPLAIAGRQPRVETNGSAGEQYTPLPAANPSQQFGRSRRIITESDDSSDEMPVITTTTATPQAGRMTSGAVKDVSGDVSSPSVRSPSPIGVVPSLPASFDLNAYRARGGGSPRRGRGTGVQSQTHGRGGGVPSPDEGGSTRAQSQAESGRGDRWVTRQGTGSPGRNRGELQIRGFGRGQNTSPNASRGGGNQPGRGQSVQHVRSRGRGFDRGSRSAGGVSRAHSSDSSLVDIEPTVTTNLVMPPPGFDLRIEHEGTPLSTNLLDEPLSNIQRPSIPPASSSIINPIMNSAAAGTSSGTSSGSGQYYVNTFNPRPDVAAMEQEQRRILMAQKEELARQSGETTPNSHIGRGKGSTNVPGAASVNHPTVSSSNAKVQREDEGASRRYHYTMGQRAPNPSGKGKPKKPEETKKETKARIARAKAEAHGSLPTAWKPERSSPKMASSGDEVDKDMSVRKRQALKKSSLMAESDPVTAEDELRRSQTTKLIDSLKPLFEAGRAFNGKLRFEMQFGQVLSAFPRKGGQYQFIDLQEWHRRFHPQLGMLPEVASFTNILTTNGADADRILDMKSPAPGPIPVWSKSEPIPRAVTYEFQCQSKDNEEFWLVVDQNGTFEIRRSPTSIGMVNLHFPGQIWDACGMVGGVMEHCFSEAVVTAAKAFGSSLYIPPGLKKMSITYRLPDTNEMTVKNVLIKRRSLHGCNMLGKHDFQLQMTEVQTLYHQFHKNDKKLGQGFVKDYSQMVNDGRLHYEVSLIHRGVNELLETNANLELGELTDVWSEAQILSRDVVRNIVDLTSLVVSKIDGIGSKNIGTLFRKDIERQEQERQFGPNAGAGLVSGAVTSRINPDAASHIQGVRGGRADVVWQDGRPYAFGFGGALVPIMDGQGNGSDEVVPDDSASQVGGLVGGLVGPATSVRTIHPAQAAKISTNVQPRAGYGFW